MHLLELPIEILWMIVDRVGVTDVVALEQVCKYMNTLINTAPQVLWKHQLENECNRNALFGSSYGHLTTAYSLKKAATTSYELSNSITRASRDTSSVFMNSKVLTIPQNPLETGSKKDSSRDPIEEVWLVPGGRFVVLFRESSLEILDVSTHVPVLVKSMDLSGVEKSGFARIVHKGVVNSRKFQMIYETIESRNVHDNLLGPEDVAISYILLEFTGAESDSNPMNVCVKGKATFVIREAFLFRGVSVAGENFVFLLDEFTVLWNPVSNVHTGWMLHKTIATASTSVELIASSDAVFYITKHGVYGLQFPWYQPTTGSLISCAKIAEENFGHGLLPDFYLPHNHVVHSGDGKEPCIRILDAQRRTVSTEKDIHELFYDIHESVNVVDPNDPENVLSNSVFHRYKLTLNAKYPGQSRLNHVATLPVLVLQDVDELPYECTITAQNSQVAGGGSRRCGQQAYTIWDDAERGTTHISKSTLDSGKLASSSSDNGNMLAVPLAYLGLSPGFELHVNSSLCAASGKIVSCWWTLSDGDDDQITDHLVLHELL